MVPQQICAHLDPTQKHCGPYWKIFTGQGWHYGLCCPTCRRGEPLWREATQDEMDTIEDRGYWEGVQGEPEVLRRPSGQTFLQVPLSLNELDSRTVKAVVALTNGWLALTEKGELVAFDTATVHLLTTVSLNLALHLSLCVSPDESLVAVYETRGCQGLVLERSTGNPLSQFQRTDSHAEVSPFGIAFVEHENRSLLIYATAWNRLDISDPRTGQCLTERTLPTSQQGVSQPHDMDYFHGALFPSPQGGWIADDGWVWHPIGVVLWWSLERWLAGNVWESEEASPSPCARNGFWGGPICWIDETTLAVWGIGSDESWLLPGVRLFEMPTGRERRWFPGPPSSRKGCEFWEPETPFHNGWMVYDEVLFVCSGEHGISVWDVRTGAWLLEDASFYPVSYQRSTKTFLSFCSDGTFLRSTLSA